MPTLPTAENDEFAHRVALVSELRAVGIDPYPPRFLPSHTTADIHGQFNDLKPGAAADCALRVAGRVMSVRQIGKQAFVDLADHAGMIQLSIREGLIRPSYETFRRFVDRGDILGVSGSPIRTRRGELSVHV